MQLINLAHLMNLGGAYSTQYSLEKCKFKEGASAPFLTFGDTSSKEICWELESSKDSPTNNIPKQEINNLLSDRWNKLNVTWSGLNNSPWRAACLNNGKGWIITQPSDGEYLGLCLKDANRVERSMNNTFFRKEVKDEKIERIKICLQNCWNNNAQAQETNLKQYESPKENNWMELKFRSENQ